MVGRRVRPVTETCTLLVFATQCSVTTLLKKMMKLKGLTLSAPSRFSAEKKKFFLRNFIATLVFMLEINLEPFF